MKNSTETSLPDANWHYAAPLDRLIAKTTLKIRVQNKQVALFITENGVRACDNRCPHEGYPLSQGSISDTCILTCNWHNWKFNLESGENLFGGDSLRTYPVEIREKEVWIDMKELPYQLQYDRIVANLRYAFDNNSYDQIARECARLSQLGADPMDTLRLAIEWSWQKMEFGWTHAYAGMADWLQLYDENIDSPEIQLTCLLESISHASFDVLREGQFPFTDQVKPFSTSGFQEAIELEHEDLAISMVAGGIEAGLGFDEFEAAFSHAALAHYNDFGHSLIYVTKAKELVERLGNQVLKPLLFSLTRSFIYSAREDRIPEFRNYAGAVEKWGQGTETKPCAESWYRKSINQSLDATVACSSSTPETLYKELLVANAISMLGFDISQQSKVYTTVSGNVGWLDFTHGLTFANAVRKQCSRFPSLWPQGLLQMACFVGRNSAYTTENHDLAKWRVAKPDGAISDMIESLFSHGIGEHIVSVHLVKTTLAIREEITSLSAEDTSVLVASLNRFVHSPLKRRIPRRVAHQSLQFVGSDSNEELN